MAEITIERDERVVGPDGYEIGRVKHVIVDGPSRQVTDLVIAEGDAEFLVPLASVDRLERGTLQMRAMPDAVRSGQGFDRAAYHEVLEEDVAVTTGMNAPGGATLEQATRDSAVIEDSRAAAMPADARQQPMREQAAQTGKNITVPVVEEKLTAGVREVEGGKFRLTKTVTEEEKTINVPLEREEVHITERDVARRPATEAEMNAMNRDIEVPLRAQEAVVSKEARVTGEVEIRKDMVQETQQVSDTVRREEVHVTDRNDPRIHMEGERGATEGGATQGGKTVTDKRKYDAQGNLVDEKITEQPNRRG